jgi:ribosomal protein L14
MITINSKVKILDICGAYVARIFRIKNSRRAQGKVGKFIVCSILVALPDNKKVKKHDVKKGVIVQTKKIIYRNYLGSSLYFKNNYIVLFSKNVDPLGNRLRGSVTQELRFKNLAKILLISPYIV